MELGFYKLHEYNAEDVETQLGSGQAVTTHSQTATRMSSKYPCKLPRNGLKKRMYRRNNLEAEKYATGNSTNISGAEQGSAAVREFGEGVATHNQSRIRPRRYLL